MAGGLCCAVVISLVMTGSVRGTPKFLHALCVIFERNPSFLNSKSATDMAPLGMFTHSLWCLMHIFCGCARVWLQDA